EEHSFFVLKKRDEPLFKLKTDDYKGWAKGLRECGYATNKKYADLLIKIIEENDLHECDKLGMEFIKKGKMPDRKESKTKKEKRKEKENNNEEGKGKGKAKERDEEQTETPRSINIGSDYTVTLSPNRVKYIIAKDGETHYSLADAFDMNVWQIRKYNDLEKGNAIKEGTIIYLQPKRNRMDSSAPSTYTPEAGEDLRTISQKFALKLNSLQKLNEGYEAGNVVRLR
ncbi:MAG: LysM peptidoglycan-binding domain-containing protein, partial [Flavobacteriales bacterium]|nr:LysM peptidoglycan-binding domain-containing protein [Flavobacteriales bacterium]